MKFLSTLNTPCELQLSQDFVYQDQSGLRSVTKQKCMHLFMCRKEQPHLNLLKSREQGIIKTSYNNSGFERPAQLRPCRCWRWGHSLWLYQDRATGDYAKAFSRNSLNGNRNLRKNLSQAAQGWLLLGNRKTSASETAWIGSLDLKFTLICLLNSTKA